MLFAEADRRLGIADGDPVRDFLKHQISKLDL